MTLWRVWHRNGVIKASHCPGTIKVKMGDMVLQTITKVLGSDCTEKGWKGGTVLQYLSVIDVFHTYIYIDIQLDTLHVCIHVRILFDYICKWFHMYMCNNMKSNPDAPWCTLIHLPLLKQNSWGPAIRTLPTSSNFQGSMCNASGLACSSAASQQKKAPPWTSAGHLSGSRCGYLRRSRIILLDVSNTAGYPGNSTALSS